MEPADGHERQVAVARERTKLGIADRSSEEPRLVRPGAVEVVDRLSGRWPEQAREGT